MSYEIELTAHAGPDARRSTITVGEPEIEAYLLEKCGYVRYPSGILRDEDRQPPTEEFLEEIAERLARQRAYEWRRYGAEPRNAKEGWE